MFKLTRATLAELTAVAALAAGIGAAVTAPDVADAAPWCSRLQMPGCANVYAGDLEDDGFRTGTTRGLFSSHSTAARFNLQGLAH